MKQYVFLVFWTFFALGVHGQSSIDTTYYEKELTRLKEIEGSTPEERIQAYSKLKKKAIFEGYSKGSLQAALGIALMHHTLGEHESAWKLADSVNKVAKKLRLKKQKAEANFIMGRTSFHLERYYSAADEFIKVIKMSTQEADKEIIADSYRNLANIYHRLGDFKESKEYHLKSMKLAEELGNQYRYLTSHYNYANILVEEKKFEEALTIFKDISNQIKNLDNANALSILPYLEGARLECNPSEISTLKDIYDNLSRAESNKNRLPNAELDHVVLYMSFADYYLHTKNPIKALDYIQKSTPLAKGYGEFAEKHNLLQKSRYYELIGNKDSALIFYKLYEERRVEAIRNKERAKVHELNLRYETEKKDKDLASKDLELQLMAEASEKQKLYFIVIFGTAFLLGMGVLVIYLKNKNRLLDKAREAALQAAKTKSMFLDVITHELRTPLSTIAGSIYLLEGENDPKTRKGLMKSIKFSSQYLNKLIENTVLVKTLGDVRPGKQHKVRSLQRFNCRELMAGVRGALVDSKNNNELQITIDQTIPEYIIGPELDLSRILVNLIGNSDKFTKNGLIKISVEKSMVTSEKGIGITFTVSDNGDGIKESEKDKVFDAFYSGEAYKNEQYTGMGLGLNLVKGLLEKHGAAPKLESVYGIGTSISFTMEFEVAHTAHNAGSPSKAQKKTKAKGSILLVEDNKANQEMTKNIIERLGYQCDVADNGKMAVEKYRILPYSLVLMDMMMPVMNGFEATANINEIDPKATVVALTAVSKEKYADIFKELNIASIISKPVDVKIIKETLESYLDHGPWAA